MRQNTDLGQRLIQAAHVRNIYQYCFAGINFRIDSGFSLTGQLHKRYSPFQEKSGLAQIDFFFNEIDPNFSNNFTKTADIKTNIKKHSKYTGHIFSNPLFYHELVLQNLSDNASHMDSIFIDSNQSSISIYDFFSNQLRVFFSKKMTQIMKDSRMGPYSLAPFLVPFSSTMIHSAALVRDSKAAVFLSPDEGGKTTSVTLSPQGTILSDDHNIIREMNGDLFAYGTPWGNYQDNSTAIVGGFFILHKANKFSLKPERKDTLLSYLWNEHLAYHFFLPKKLSKKHFDFLYKISRRVPVYNLEFPKDYIDWSAIDLAMM